MGEEIYLGMMPADFEGKPYAKYWNPEMGPCRIMFSGRSFTVWKPLLVGKNRDSGTTD